MSSNIYATIYNCIGILKRGMWRFCCEPLIRRALGGCGQDVRIQEGSQLYGVQNIIIGNHVSLGDRTYILSTRARVEIGNYVLFGPDVKLITGNHTVGLVGKYMWEITDTDKGKEDDDDIIIEDDVWIGAGATILKGVTIARGSVVAAGAVVTKNYESYSILGGVPARVIGRRFNCDEIEEHERIIKSRI